MKKSIFGILLSALLFTSCANEFNRVYKTTDNTYKYEYAKECFANGKYVQHSRNTIRIIQRALMQRKPNSLSV